MTMLTTMHSAQLCTSRTKGSCWPTAVLKYCIISRSGHPEKASLQLLDKVVAFNFMLDDLDKFIMILITRIK
jgi:hypothetical protein